MSDGGEPKQLTDGDWDDKDPTWSPDGTHIAFASSRAEDRWQLPCPDIYVLSIENEQAGTRIHDRTVRPQHPHPRPYGGSGSPTPFVFFAFMVTGRQNDCIFSETKVAFGQP